MSAKQMGLVFDLRDLPPTQRLVLLALADHADHDGNGARPSVALIAWKVETAVRTVQRALVELRQKGLIEPIGGGGGRKVTEYRLTLGGVTNCHPRGDTDDTPGVTPSRARDSEPSLEPTAPGTSPRRPDPVWDALVEHVGPVATKVEQTRRGRVAQQLRAAYGCPKTGDDVRSTMLAAAIGPRVAALREHWQGRVTVTDTALAAHWSLAGTLLLPGRRDDRLGEGDVL